MRAVAPGDPRRVRVSAPGVALSVSDLDALPADCLPAVELDGASGGCPEVLVPAAIVDDPARDCPPGWVDASPSGAAASLFKDYAATHALLESIERDAVQACWVLRPPVAWVHPADVAADRAHADSRHAARLADWLDVSALTARTLLLPTGVAGVTCALTLLLDERHGCSARAGGSRAGRSLPGIVHGSAREAIQVLAALRRVAAGYGALAGDAHVTGESARARYCLGPRPAAHLRSWLECCREGAAPAAPSGPGSAGERAALVAGLRAEGLRPLACDLTPRLPDSGTRARVARRSGARARPPGTRGWTSVTIGAGCAGGSSAGAERTGGQVPADLGAVAPLPADLKALSSFPPA